MQMLDRAGGGGGPRMSEDGESSYSRPAAPARPAAASSAGFDEDAALEDEIPF
jgi:hypothetical protein